MLNNWAQADVNTWRVLCHFLSDWIHNDIIQRHRNPDSVLGWWHSATSWWSYCQDTDNERITIHQTIWSRNQVRLIWVLALQTQETGMFAQLRLKSVWACSQSNQSIHCQHGSNLDHKLPLNCVIKTLIRLGGCPVWSEFLLEAYASLLVLSCHGSFFSRLQFLN